MVRQRRDQRKSRDEVVREGVSLEDMGGSGHECQKSSRLVTAPQGPAGRPTGNES